MIQNGYEHHFIQTNGITLHVVMAGPKDGEPVVLLHGFPEFWFGWRNQIAYLARQGFRVIVPDQRGYNLSDKPRGIAAYCMDELTKDIVGLIEALGYEDVYLAGHDWGAAVAWWLASHQADYVRKLVVLNVPYPTLLAEAIRRGNKEQLQKSRYIFSFQLPWLPERFFKKMNQGDGRNLLLASSHKDTFTPEELLVYEHAWVKPGAVIAMINWYRAAIRTLLGEHTPEPGSIETPTLMLWGEQDVALGKELAQPSIDLCQNGRLIFFPNASHWLQHDESEAVNQHLTTFFGNK